MESLLDCPRFPHLIALGIRHLPILIRVYVEICIEDHVVAGVWIRMMKIVHGDGELCCDCEVTIFLDRNTLAICSLNLKI